MGRNALLDILQGASNAAADSVAVPVDLIAAGLRRVGVPVPQNALGGTQWQEQMGLRRKPQNALLGMAGETLGMISPVAAAAKAPQIAAGMLQAGRNLAAPSTQGAMGQRGALMYHGGTFVDNPAAYKQGLVIDGVPGVSFTPSKRSARDYATHNQGDVYAIDDAAYNIYRLGADPALDAAVNRGDWKAVSGAGFDGLEVVPGKETVLFDYALAAAKAKKAEVFDAFAGKWRKP